jgi:hypothetical protein
MHYVTKYKKIVISSFKKAKICRNLKKNTEFYRESYQHLCVSNSLIHLKILNCLFDIDFKEENCVLIFINNTILVAICVFMLINYI